MAKSNSSSDHQVHALGEKIAAILKTSPDNVRYAHYMFHNGKQWTVRYQWEQLVNNHWRPIPDDDWLDLHGTPR